MPPASAASPPRQPPPSDPDDRWRFYEAAVGKLSADEYIPIFQRFERRRHGIIPRAISWSSGAFVATVLWLAYRRMYGYALLYFPLSMPVVLAVITVLALSAEQPCPGAPPPAHLPLYVGLFCIYLAAVLLVVPAYANRLYFHRVSRRIVECADRSDDEAECLRSLAERGGVDRRAAIVLGVLLPALLLGIAALWPPHADRAQIAAALSAISAAGGEVTRFYDRNKRLPQAAELQPRLVATPPLSQLIAQDGGEIKAVLKMRCYDGAVFTLSPLARDGRLIWRCSNANAPAQLVPEECKR